MMTVPPQLTSSLPSFSYPSSFRHPPPASSSGWIQRPGTLRFGASQSEVLQSTTFQWRTTLGTLLLTASAWTGLWLRLLLACSISSRISLKSCWSTAGGRISSELRVGPDDLCLTGPYVFWPCWLRLYELELAGSELTLLAPYPVLTSGLSYSQPHRQVTREMAGSHRKFAIGAPLEGDYGTLSIKYLKYCFSQPWLCSQRCHTLPSR